MKNYEKTLQVLVDKHERIKLPEYKTSGSSGCDLRAAEGAFFKPFEVKMIPTGIKIAIPNGFEAQVRTRSGMGKKGLFVINSPGTIDSDYRGEIKVLLANFNNSMIRIEEGDRIAQLVFSPVIKANFVNTYELPLTERGDGGFGHTGIK